MEDYDEANDPLLGIRKEDTEKQIESQIQEHLRQGFIAKVFGIIAYQIALLILLVLFAFLNESFRQLIYTSTFLYILSFIISITCLVVPIINPSLFEKVPTNYILLTIFTLSYSWLVAFYTVHFDPKSVLVALFLTLITVVSISIYALWTKTDYTVYGGVLFTSLTLLIFCGIIEIFFPIKLLYLISLYGGLIIFCLYLLYDVQLLVGNRIRKFKEDDYILAAINIYLDIIGIFIRILAIVGGKKN